MSQKEQREALQREWQERVSQYQRTEETVRGWCKTHDVPEHQMRYWLRKLGGAPAKQPSKGDESRFAPLPSSSSRQSTSGVAVRGGSLRVEVQQGFDPQVLLDVVQSLVGYDQ